MPFLICPTDYQRAKVDRGIVRKQGDFELILNLLRVYSRVGMSMNFKRVVQFGV